VPDSAKRGVLGDIYVVSRKALPEIQKSVPADAFGLLLKPVKAPALRAFFSAALSWWAASNRNGDLEAARDSRSDLLQALLEANLRLQEGDQDRTNFLARALHDLRTPLTALQGYCDMLIQQKAGPVQPDQIDLLQRMQHGIGRLTRMSRAMFELSVHHNTEAKPNLVRANIDTCVQNAVNLIVPIADDKGIGISIDLEPPDTHLYLDAGAIEQVLVNLLENACKFTPRGGSVEIRGRVSYSDAPGDRKEGRMIPVYRIDIQDTGMGILPEHISSIFEEYTSYAGARDRSGGGLGLAICKMLIGSHKGSIWADSNPGGTKISFTIPVRQGAIPGTQGFADSHSASASL
jgi:signal transduction histidine kinase